jgi:predicted PurR-regulated permease PerM
MAVQIITLRGELDRLHEENQNLRGMLNQITKNYSELQGQLLMAMQKQAQDYHQGQVNIVLIMITHLRTFLLLLLLFFFFFFFMKVLQYPLVS